MSYKHLTASGGSTYAWSGPNGFASAIQNPTIPTASGLQAGTYTVTVTNASGCTKIATTTITVNTAAATASTTTPTICEGSGMNISATGGGTYAWSGPNGFTSALQNPTIAAATAAAAGTYTVIVTTANSCTATAQTSVTVNKATITASSNSPICVNQNLTLNATAGASSYAWSGPNGFTATTQNPTIPISTVANAGTYSVTITDVNGCVGSASTIVAINPLPNPTATKPVVCKGEPIDLNSNGLSPLQWTFPDGTTTTTANPSIVSTTAANSGTYTLKNTGS